MFCASNRVFNGKVFRPEYMDVFNPWGLSFFLAGGAAWGATLRMIMILRSSMLNSSHMIHFVIDHGEDLSLIIFICRGESMKSSLQRLWQKKEQSFCKPQMQTLCNSLWSHHLLHCTSHRLWTLLLLVCILLAFVICFLLPCVGRRYLSLCQISQCTKVSLIVRFGEVV